LNLRKLLLTKSAQAIIIVAACIIGIVSTGCTTARSYNSETSANVILGNARAMNINTASATELENIPHIGASLASKIVEHRERYRPFRKVEHIMWIDGISDKRFREIKDQIKVE
jgi:competence protein ComEA